MRTSELVMVVTWAEKKKQELAQSQSELYQERDESVTYEIESGSEQGLCLLFLPRPLTTGVQQQVRSSSSGSRRPR